MHPVRGAYGAHGGRETAIVRDFRRTIVRTQVPSEGKRMRNWDVFWTTSELLASISATGRLQLSTRENGIRRRNKERDFYYETDFGKESRGCTTAYSSNMSETHEKGYGESVKRHRPDFLTIVD